MRSYLFAPATNPALIPKALASDADVVVLDLEDAILDGQSEEGHDLLRAHREAIAARPTHIRIGVEDEGYAIDDLAVAIEVGAAGIRLPKASDPHLVSALVSKVPASESFAIHLTIEDAVGLGNLAEMAACSEQITKAIFGERDFMADLGVNTVGPLTDHARADLAISSRQAGLGRPIDGAYIDVKDLDGLRASAQKAKSLGFWGKSAIHPIQVPVINEVFTPTASEIEWARRVGEAYSESVAAGSGVAMVDGQFVDAAVARRARDLLGDSTD